MPFLSALYHRVALFGAALLLVVAGQAQAQGQPQPAIWQIEGKTATVYLLGTIHLLEPGMAWRSPAIDRAVANAEALWLEVDQSAAAGPAFQAHVAARGLDPQGPGLSSLLGPDLSAQFAGLTQELGVPATAFEPMRPWFAAVTLTLVYTQRQGYDPQSGVEAVLERDFRDAGKPVHALEKPEQAIAALADQSLEGQKALLVDTIDQLADGGAVLDAMAAAWQAGDLKALKELALTPIQQHQEAYQALLVDRNRAWLPQIEAVIAGRGRHLVAVGAAHLIGDDGLVAMLQARGHPINRLEAVP
ncbi:MAG: TraB/GumN family protein [Sphingomonadales bacterium]